MNTLKDLFLDEVADMYDAEKRITKALPKMAKAATDPKLQQAFKDHLVETEGHVEKLESIFAAFDEKPKRKTCQATVGILKEGDEMAEENEDSPTINAALIAAAQKVEHYEMTSYGTLHAWAQLLGNEEAADIIEQILGEEKAADTKLNAIASSSANQEALGETSDEPETVGSSKRRGSR